MNAPACACTRSAVQEPSGSRRRIIDRHLVVKPELFKDGNVRLNLVVVTNVLRFFIIFFLGVWLFFCFVLFVLSLFCFFSTSGCGRSCERLAHAAPSEEEIRT